MTRFAQWNDKLFAVHRFHRRIKMWTVLRTSNPDLVLFEVWQKPGFLLKHYQQPSCNAKYLIFKFILLYKLWMNCWKYKNKTTELFKFHSKLKKLFCKKRKKNVKQNTDIKLWKRIYWFDMQGNAIKTDDFVECNVTVKCHETSFASLIIFLCSCCCSKVYMNICTYFPNEHICLSKNSHNAFFNHISFLCFTNGRVLFADELWQNDGLIDSQR